MAANTENPVSCTALGNALCKTIQGQGLSKLDPAPIFITDTPQQQYLYPSPKTGQQGFRLHLRKKSVWLCRQQTRKLVGFVGNLKQLMNSDCGLFKGTEFSTHKTRLTLYTTFRGSEGWGWGAHCWESTGPANGLWAQKTGETFEDYPRNSRTCGFLL